MDEKANGVILRVRPLTDSSLIVHWLTREHGRLSTVAKGARRAKSPMRGKLDLLFESDFSFRRSRQSDLHTLREVQPLANHPNLRLDIKRLQLFAYATRLIERATEPEHALPGIHAIFTTLLKHLENNPTRPALTYALEIKTLNELGLAPPLGNDNLDKGTCLLMEQLAVLNWDAIITLTPTREQATTAGRFLGNFIQHHLEFIPKGRDQLLA